MKEPQKTAIAFFNFAHSYATSALALRNSNVRATHSDAPVSFLYFHAIELYLKSFLIACGLTEEELSKRKYGHKIRKLADAAKERGLDLADADEQVVQHLADTDNIIKSRYIRLGNHSRLPTDALHETCYRLHTEIGPKAYDGSGVSRRPILELGPLNKLESLAKSTET